MKSFLINLLKFSLLPVVFFAPSFWMLWQVGEFHSLSYVGTRARSTEPVLVGPAYSNFQTPYQLKETQIRKPQVLVLGNSHVSTFRAKFFKDPTDFYNAAHAVLALSDFTHFIDSLESPPKVLMVAMSPSYFNPDNTKQTLITRPNPYASVALYDPMLESFFRKGGWWKVYADWRGAKFTLAQLFDPQTGNSVLGLRAAAERYGFTNDGSDYYGDVIESAEAQASIAQGIQDLAKSISESKSYMQGMSAAPYGSGISPQALDELRAFLAECKKRNIFVVGYVPPIAQAGYDRLERYPDAMYAYAFKNLAPTLRALYREYGFDLYDFTEPKSYGGSDSEFLDAGLHVSEKADLRMLIRMAENTPALQPYVDIPSLKKLLVQATSSVTVFGPLDLEPKK